MTTPGVFIFLPLSEGLAWHITSGSSGFPSIALPLVHLRLTLPPLASSIFKTSIWGLKNLETLCLHCHSSKGPEIVLT